jgi:hypothetical protein
MQRKTTLRLKLEGDRLTGTIVTQLSQPRTNAVPVMDAKLVGEAVSFTVTRELNGKKYTQKFSGKVSGDTIKGRVEFERDGKPESREWVARRANEKGDEQSNSRAISNTPSGRSGSGWQFPSAPKRGP